MRLMHWLSAAAVAGMVTGGTPALVSAQVIRGDTARDVHWTGQIAGGRWLRVRSLSGPIRVTASDGNELVVDAHKRWRRGDPGSVRITIERTGTSDGDVLVCALWGNQTSCDEDGYRSRSHHHWDGDDDVEVEFTVRLPKGVNLATSTINGSVYVQGVSGRVEANTVNGGVEAGTTGGPVQASTVNGDVAVHMGTVADAVSLDYSTVNGSVTVYLPDKLNADIEMSTVNGSFHSDYPLSLSGRIEPRHIRATIGTGGPRLRCSTVNGSIDLRKTT